MKTPESLKATEKEYKEAAWQTYTLAELGWWVHLFTKRAHHRADNEFGKEKRRKDLNDAQNYLNMMQAMVDDAKTRLL